MKPTTKRLKLDDITPDAAYMVRRALDEDLVQEYAAAMQEGAEFPPVHVFNLGGNLVLVDGWHRYKAASVAGLVDIDAVSHGGNHEEALAFALGANKAHGLRLSREDVRHAIGIALKQWPGMSNNGIATYIGCSDHTVADVRAGLESTSQIAKLDTRTGKDGKARPAARPTVRDVCADAEREAAEKDEAESGDADRVDAEAARSKQRDEWDDWAAWESAAADLRAKLGALEGIAVPANCRQVAAAACNGLAVRLGKLAASYDANGRA